MASAPVRSKVPPKRILVVEDDLLLAHTIEMALTADSHQVQLASNGEEALSMFGDGAFDLVITDFVLPKMDGLDLAEVIKARAPTVPILLITAYAERIQPEMGKVSNIDGLLKKPFFVGQLQDALAKVLGSALIPQPKLYKPGATSPRC